MTGSSTLDGRLVVSVLGSETETPWWSIGAVTMKMIRSTSMTSTRGVTLMSARWSKGSPFGPAENAMALRVLREVALGQVEELEREVVHRGAHLPDLTHEVVVPDHRGDRRVQSRGRVDPRLLDARRDGRDRRRSRDPDRVEGRHDAPDGAEEADEGARRGRRRQERQPARQARDLGAGGALERALDAA